MVKESIGERVFNIINILIMILLLLLIMVPLMNVVFTSLVSAQEAARRPFILFPEKFDLSSYKLIFRGGSVILSGYEITIFRVVAGTLINMIFTYFTAYAMALKKLPGRNAITIFFFFTMLFSGGLIPYYILIKSVGLMNNVWVYILPSIISVWNTLLMRNFIMNIPDELRESAELDGAGELYIIFSIIMPLSLSAFVTIALFYAVGHWNSWWDAYLFVSDTRKQPLQLILRNILFQAQPQINSISGKIDAADEIKPVARAVQTAAVVVTTLPITILYPFLQKYFIKGIMIGSVKG